VDKADGMMLESGARHMTLTSPTCRHKGAAASKGNKSWRPAWTVLGHRHIRLPAPFTP
jgi:hypothetical protein